jgi:hypothetical protein
MSALLLLDSGQGGAPAPTNNVTAAITIFAAPPTGLRILAGFAAAQSWPPPAMATVYHAAAPGLRLMGVSPSSGNVPTPDTYIEPANDRIVVARPRRRVVTGYRQ